MCRRKKKEKESTCLFYNKEIWDFLISHDLYIKLNGHVDKNELYWRLVLMDGRKEYGKESSYTHAPILYVHCLNIQEGFDKLMRHVSGSTVYFGDKEVLFPIFIQE